MYNFHLLSRKLAASPLALPAAPAGYTVLISIKQISHIASGCGHFFLIRPDNWDRDRPFTKKQQALT
jgi:hypothetical protein